MSQDIKSRMTELNSIIQSDIFGFEKLKVSIKEVRQRFQYILKVGDSLQTLAKEGWYAPMTLTHPEIIDLARLLNQGHIDKVDDFFMTHANDHYKYLRSNILSKFPKRQKPLEAALNAYSKNEYYLSIPVFYAQIDGIFSELTNTNLFKDGKGEEIPDNSKVSKWIDKADSDMLIGLLLEPLRVISPHKKVESFKKSVPTHPINRHAIMHGRSLNYGEKKSDASKVLLLLNYVCETVYRANKKQAN